MPHNDFIAEHKTSKDDQPTLKNNTYLFLKLQQKALPKAQDTTVNTERDENQPVITIPVSNDQEALQLQPEKSVQEYYQTLFNHKSKDRNVRLQELQKAANHAAVATTAPIIHWMPSKVSC